MDRWIEKGYQVLRITYVHSVLDVIILDPSVMYIFVVVPSVMYKVFWCWILL